ncbi:conserved hypothetical protein [Tenacibaculum maritimum]|nr:conserved hypothetical protein [Tenacibaculum maritimum]CAA0234418.1 conserved hypothetical protein [Tenacibaculum maritimum]
MAKKGKAKNTVNKAKHSRLLKQKENKIRLEKQRNKERLKEIIQKMNALKRINLSFAYPFFMLLNSHFLFITFTENCVILFTKFIPYTL